MSTSLTIEQALALMVNMDFIPDGETVQSMASYFLEDAEVEYENASSLGRYQLKMRMEACEARYSLVLSLTEALSEYDDDMDDNPLACLETLSDWASDKYGIVIPNTTSTPTTTSAAQTKPPNWENVTIKVYADYKIGYKIDNADWKRTSFLDVGLMGKRKIEPNELGGILIGLSQNLKYPISGVLQSKNKTAISKLRRCLEKLTGLKHDPFLPINKSNGYKPRFKLIDDRLNADERAMREARHVVSADDVTSSGRNYNSEDISDDDPASKFLANYDK